MILTMELEGKDQRATMTDTLGQLLAVAVHTENER